MGRLGSIGNIRTKNWIDIRLLVKWATLRKAGRNFTPAFTALPVAPNFH